MDGKPPSKAHVPRHPGPLPSGSGLPNPQPLLPPHRRIRPATGYAPLQNIRSDFLLPHAAWLTPPLPHPTLLPSLRPTLRTTSSGPRTWPRTHPCSCRATSSGARSTRRPSRVRPSSRHRSCRWTRWSAPRARRSLSTSRRARAWASGSTRRKAERGREGAELGVQRKRNASWFETGIIRCLSRMQSELVWGYAVRTRQGRSGAKAHVCRLWRWRMEQCLHRLSARPRPYPTPPTHERHCNATLKVKPS